MLISLSRLAITWTCSAEDASYPASYLARVTRPDAPAKTTTTSGSPHWDGDLGSSKQILAVHVGAANFPTVTVLVDDVPTFDSGSLLTSGARSVGTNVGNGRRCDLYVPGSPPTRRYVRILPSGTPDAGASAYRLGYVWSAGTGDLTAWPASLRYGGDPTPIDPFEDLLTKSQVRQRDSRGPEIMRFAGVEFADLSVNSTPLQTDAARATMDLERRWAAADFALIAMQGAADPAWVGVLRQATRARWRLDAAQASASVDWEEVTGP